MAASAYDDVVGFAPTASGHHITTLILGSAPSVASLQHQQYYGHPHNHFWRIMGDLFAAGRDIPYHKRTRILSEHGIAVWDVLQSCERSGSLDSAIEKSSMQVNDFAKLFKACPSLHTIILNGRFAEKTFHQHVEMSDELTNAIQTAYMPSTSPANAGMTYAEKLQTWREILAPNA